MKIVVHLLIIAALAFGWKIALDPPAKQKFSGTIEEVRKEMVANGASEEEIEKTLAEEVERKMVADGVPEEEIVETLKEMEPDEGEGAIMGMLMAFVTAGYVGVMFVVYILPAMANKASGSVYDSGEMAETDPMHDARSMVAQGDYQGAITAFHDAAKVDPMNRLPYVEIAKLQRTTLENPDAAIQTLTKAIEGQSWEENDAAFLMFRLAEIYHEDKHDIAMACAVMHQVIDQFPATRHSANAQHKLGEWKTGA